MNNRALSVRNNSSGIRKNNCTAYQRQEEFVRVHILYQREMRTAPLNNLSSISPLATTNPSSLLCPRICILRPGVVPCIWILHSSVVPFDRPHAWPSIRGRRIQVAVRPIATSFHQSQDTYKPS